MVAHAILDGSRSPNILEGEIESRNCWGCIDSGIGNTQLAARARQNSPEILQLRLAFR
jgi:hypothetical protein